MIPYDDLVAALSAWRARQGLPVSTMGGGGTAAAPQPGSGPTAMPGSGPYDAGSGPYGQPGSGPYGQPGSGPHRGGPPPAPRSKPHSVPPPLEMGDDAMQEVDAAEMLEEQYEAEGADYATSFDNNAEDQTSIGETPERTADPNDWNGGRGGNDW